jgi:type IX secretion system PorP/SprF family membrane protein
MIKKNRLRILLIFVGIHLFNTVSGQQLPQFSQYIFNGLHVNPAYAGYKNEGYIQSTYRSQWMNLQGAPRTMSITADFSANEGKMGFGVSYVSDKIGLTQSNLGMLTYAYRINTGEQGRLSLGVSAGFSQNIFDPSDITTVSPDDPILPENRVSTISPKINSGVFYHNDSFYAGIAAFNLIGNSAAKQQNLATAFNDVHYFFTTGGIIPISTDIKLKPSMLVKHTSGSPTNFDINAMALLKEKFWVGASYRSNVRIFKDQLQDDLSNRNALAFVMEYFVTSGLRLGYAYDHNMNALSSFRNQSHEFSIGIYLKSKKEIVNNPRWF